MNSRSTLIRTLQQNARCKGIALESLAERFDMNADDWQDFLESEADGWVLTDKQIKAMASFMGQPNFVMHILLGLLSLDDFVIPDSTMYGKGSPIEATLNRGLIRIEQDDVIPGGLPPEVWTASDSIKALILAMYEYTTANEVFPTTQTLGWVWDMHQGVHEKYLNR